MRGTFLPFGGVSYSRTRTRRILTLSKDDGEFPQATSFIPSYSHILFLPMSSSPDTISCGGNENTTDMNDGCETDHFCFLPIGAETPHCVHCVFCSVLSANCPSRCLCTSHDQCDPYSYCGVFDSNQNICTPCESCLDRRPVPFDGNASCPEKCLCQSSLNDCREGTYCQRQPLGGWFPENNGLCISCTSQIGCAEHLILGGNDNLTCQDLCPADFQCTEHSNCHALGRWCSMNHRCNNCSQACWTEQRLLENAVEVTCESDCNSTAILESQTSNLQLNEWTELPFISIDYSCPETCCDWGMQRSANSRTTVFTVGQCDSTVHVHGAWYDGSQLDWDSPEEFLNASNPCQLIRYEFTEGYPTVVSKVVCDDVIPACQSDNRTLALFITNETHTIYANESSFPFVASFDDTDFMCALRVASANMSMVFFTSLVVIVLFFCCLIFGLSWQAKKQKQQ